MKMLIIGAHPDDCEIDCGGLAAKYIAAGHQVRFLSVCDGSGGHHELNRNEIAARRWGETRAVAALLGIEYDVWNIPDCELVPDLYTRERMIRYIRAYQPDIMITHRPNDYHPDHRNTSLLVQDAAYLLIVPNCCPETPALKENPLIMYCSDNFHNPVFVPDVVVDIDDVIEKKLQALDCHVSQMYEWLPYTYGKLHEVPEDPEARFQWMCGAPISADTPDEEILSYTGYSRRGRFAKIAARFRKELVARYPERGQRVVYAEAYAVCEYGAELTEEKKKIFFPF